MLEMPKNEISWPLAQTLRRITVCAPNPFHLVDLIFGVEASSVFNTTMKNLDEQISGQLTMKDLAEQISKRLTQKSFCTVFGNEVSQIWPLPKEAIEKRNAAVRAFAKKMGFSAAILDPGIRVTFRKLSVIPPR